MAGKSRLGEEYKVYVDVDHDSGGSWTAADWVELKCAIDVADEVGIIAAEFPFRGDADLGARRSLRRASKLTLNVGEFTGDEAFDRIRQAAADRANEGEEIVRIRIVEGDITEVGAWYNENDFVITNWTKNTDSGAPFAHAWDLQRAVDSPNDPITDGQIAGGGGGGG